ncbi:MAG: MYXO-CTERM sorting domain-containing protein [Acidobacteriota bacterium]
MAGTAAPKTGDGDEPLTAGWALAAVVAAAVAAVRRHKTKR